MGKLNNIDELLKEKFDNFSPDAPDVWQGIQQSVQATQATTLAVGVKSIGLGIKIITAIAIVGVTITAYVLTTQKEDKGLINAPIEAPTITESPIATTTQITTTPESQQVSVAPKKDFEKTKPTQEKPPITNLSLQPSEQTEQYDIAVKPAETVESTAPVQLPMSKSQTNTVPPVVPKKAEQEQQLPVKVSETIQPPINSTSNIEPPIIPGSFSPNDDGVNDRYVILIENEELYSLVILDKEGKTVFESNDKTHTWDGRDVKSGNLCPQGKYQYVFKYQPKGAQSPVLKTGIIGLF